MRHFPAIGLQQVSQISKDFHGWAGPEFSEHTPYLPTMAISIFLFLIILSALIFL